MKKIIAFYLPQFHTFPENDEWWGKGFTEWTNTKKATPLYDNHYQPRTPLNENYYDLSKKEHIINQMDIAKKYNIYGFCYYHYWFSGKLLMEKPIEIMRNLEERINYCFCWANEPWTRSWDGLTNNIIMPQNYTGLEGWNNHFNYLEKFFTDEKYIKIDNKPVFIIYRSNNIPDFDKMVEYFNDRCISLGFSGIEIIEEYNTFQNSPIVSSNKTLYFEPMHTISFGRSFFEKVFNKLSNKSFNKKRSLSIKRFSYDKIWKHILKKNNKKSTIIPGAFVDWDNTARRGAHSTIITDATPEKFGKYLGFLLDKTSSEYVFINAWNEWAEGAYLEPDQKYKYSYLERLLQELVSNDKKEA